MAQPPAQPQSITDRIKSAFGLPSQSAPRPVKIGPAGGAAPLSRQDSFPGARAARTPYWVLLLLPTSLRGV